MRDMTWMVGALVGVVVLGTCTPTPPPAESVSTGPPECPHSWDSTRAPARAWPTVNVPEFNDCQAFVIVNTGDASTRSYTDGYFAIFANPDTVRTALEPVSTQGVPVAFIYAEKPYSPLHIEAGGNCLYFFRAAGQWRARIANAVTDGGGQLVCQEKIDSTEGQELAVRVTSHGMENGAYPVVARWDWDAEAQQQYIGVRCGAAWCEVGDPAGFASSPTHGNLALDLSPKAQRTVAVKGWYDEQYLARCEDGACKPTALFGDIFPDPALDDAASYPSNWTPVARIAIGIDDSAPEATRAEADLKWYKDKFNLERSADQQLNEVALCHGDGSTTQCGIPAAIQAKCPSLASEEDPADHGQWWLRIVGAGSGDTAYRCVIRRKVSPPPEHVVGAARWRWLLNDDTFWIRCLEGCCEAEGIGG